MSVIVKGAKEARAQATRQRSEKRHAGSEDARVRGHGLPRMQVRKLVDITTASVLELAP